MDERKACYLLSCADGFGPKTINAMKNYAGSFKECINSGALLFLKEGIINKRQEAALKEVLREKDRLLREYDGFIRRGIGIFTADDAEYPGRLKSIDAPPSIIYVKGRFPDDGIPSAAIIGARQCSDYGIEAAEYFAGELAAHGIQIVSGLAYGIDSAAARGALDRGCGSFAVLGSGINVCYPKENYGLYAEMSGENEQGRARGGVISEFHPLKDALPQHFVMRNRIIAGLSDVLIVIEAREKSGTSITVGYALNQGKDVFAMPGRINDPLGRGCNRLIRDGAIPLIEVRDVLDYFGLEDAGSGGTFTESRDTSLLSAEEKLIYGALGSEPKHIESIADKLGLNITGVMSTMFGLERKGFAVETENAYYRRT